MIPILLTGVEFTMIVSALGSLLLYNRLSKLHRWLFYYMAIMAVLNVLSHAFKQVLTYNLFMVPISGLVTLFIFARLYLHHLLPAPQPKTRVIVLLAQVLVWLYLPWSLEAIWTAQQFDASVVVLSYLIIVGLCLRYYWCLLDRAVTLDSSYHLFNGIVLTYFTISVLFFGTSNFLINAALHLVAPFWMVYGISTLLFYLYLTYTIWQHGRTQSTSRVG